MMIITAVVEIIFYRWTEMVLLWLFSTQPTMVANLLVPAPLLKTKLKRFRAIL